jgi:hypothetical protein
LTNAVVPSGISTKRRKNLVMPQGCVERAQLGLHLLKTAIWNLARANPEGISNSEAARLLGLQSDYAGKQKDYLTYSTLGLLIRTGTLKRDRETKRHKVTSSG